jgi:hypothetical protein
VRDVPFVTGRSRAVVDGAGDASTERHSRACRRARARAEEARPVGSPLVLPCREMGGERLPVPGVAASSAAAALAPWPESPAAWQNTVM